MRDNLDALALLYANGEMDPKDTAAFERLLGEDQRAREALSLAVELSRTLDGLPTPTPDPAYRGQVRQRLRAKTMPVKPRRLRGHPALWAGAGAAAVFVIGIATNAFHTPTPVEHAQTPAVTAPAVEDGKKTEPSIHDLARELVDPDVEALQLKADRLDKEAAAVKEELAKARDQAQLEEAKKRKKT